jgi:hypothetical protein
MKMRKKERRKKGGRLIRTVYKADDAANNIISAGSETRARSVKDGNKVWDGLCAD